MITILCVPDVKKDIQIRTLIKRLLTKYQFFAKLPEIMHTPTLKNLVAGAC